MWVVKLDDLQHKRRPRKVYILILITRQKADLAANRFGTGHPVKDRGLQQLFKKIMPSW